MARRLQIIGDFHSDCTFDEKAVEQLVVNYLTENPPVAQIPINGGEPDVTVLSVCATVGSKLPDLAIKDGQLIFVHDKHKIALDFGGKRKFYNQIEELATDAERISMSAPEAGLFYFVIDTAVLWTYQNGWVQITTSPKEVVLFGTELPELGSSNTLYVDHVAQEISVWDDDAKKYVVVADKTQANEMTADDITALFKNI